MGPRAASCNLVMQLCMVELAAGQMPAQKTTWQVFVGGAYEGTAFLVDSRGYFVTANHVVRFKQQQTTGGRPLIWVSNPLSPSDTAPVEVIAALCPVGDVTETCKSGVDLALLHSLKPLMSGALLVPFPLDLSDRPGRIFQNATSYGYAPPVGIWSPLFKLSVYSASTDIVGDRFNVALYASTTAGSGYSGESGGPLVVDDTVRGVVAFSKSNYSGGSANGALSATYFVPIHESVPAIMEMPGSPKVCSIITDLRHANATTSLPLDLTAIEVLQIGSVMPNPWRALKPVSGCGAPLADTFCKPLLPVCREIWDRIWWFGLGSKLMSPYSAQYVKTLGDRRTVGSAALIAADRLASRDSNTSKGIYGLSRDELTSFMSGAVKSGPDRVGPREVSSAAHDLSVVYSRLGARDTAAVWAAVSFSVDARPSAAWSLGQYYYAGGQFDMSASYFATAYTSGLHSDYVVADFNSSVNLLGVDSLRGISIIDFGKQGLGVNAETRAHSLRALVATTDLTSKVVNTFAASEPF
jgi:trypsin-like peptidase